MCAVDCNTADLRRAARGHRAHQGSPHQTPHCQQRHRCARAEEHRCTQVAGSGRIAGLAVSVVKNKEVLLQRGIGYADMNSGAPVTPDTVFRLASLSKAFASALAGLLIDEGVFNWDTRVAEVVPAFELKDSNASGKLSVRDILSQRVGLPHNTYDRMLEADEPYPVLVDKLREVPLTCAVGECYGYQNITYSLIGDVIYAMTGDFFSHQVEKRLFHPLGMTTATYGRAGLESSASWARPHAHLRSGWVPFEIDDAYYRVAPAAGVNASIKDMTQWLIAQMGGRPEVLSPALLETLHTPQINTPIERRSAPWRRVRVSETQYALGWRVFDYAGETLIFHAGAVRGYRSMIAFLPKQQFGAVMLWNCESAVPIGLLPMLLDRYLGLPQVDWAGIDAPEAPTKRARLAAGGR
ncbi:MAG: beta-lactamase family protein [Gammaproteobacteria bacterium]|nr:MAG: beta-lactamase family protein [Gammaproteobacteria bacterium]